MSIYVDTGVALAYIITNDPNHQKAKRAIDSLKHHGLIISDLSILEMLSVVSRRLHEIRIDYEFPTLISDEDKVRVIVSYCISRIGAEVRSVTPRRRKIFLPKITIMTTTPIYEASKLVYQLKLKTLDIIHLVIARLLGASMFLTLDKDIIERSKDIKRVLGIDIICQ